MLGKFWALANLGNSVRWQSICWNDWSFWLCTKSRNNCFYHKFLKPEIWADVKDQLLWKLKLDTIGTTYNLLLIASILIHWKRSYNGVNLSNATTLLKKKKSHVKHPKLNRALLRLSSLNYTNKMLAEPIWVTYTD